MKKFLFLLLIGAWSCSSKHDQVISVYTIADIYYANPKTLTITSETGHTQITFSSYEKMLKGLEDISARDTDMKSLQFHLDWLIESGYLSANVYPVLNTNCKTLDQVGEVILEYNGPNWGVDARQDVEMQLGTFYIKDTVSLCKSAYYIKVYGQD